MDIGEMKQRIEFMVEENVSDGQGGYDTTLVSKGSTWAKVTNIHGGEYFFAAAVHLEKDVSFVIRYRSDISEKWNIKFRNQKYNIQFIDADFCIFVYNRPRLVKSPSVFGTKCQITFTLRAHNTGNFC